MARPIAGRLLLLALLLSPRVAAADDYPTIATDGLYLGARLEPGAALTIAYDLDIYLTGDRVLSIGPAGSFSFLGRDGRTLGRRQDYLLAVDVLRAKVALNGGHGDLRPYLFVGGGFYYGSLPAQNSGPRAVVLSDGTMTTAMLSYGPLNPFGGLISAGGGLDVYLVHNFGLALAVVTHLSVGDQGRIPLFWAEALAGIRFGL